MKAESISLPVTPTTAEETVPLSTLRRGSIAEVACRGDACEDRELLCAMGLRDRCPLRVCRTGRICIIKMDQGRIALPQDLAMRIMVRPIGTPKRT